MADSYRSVTHIALQVPSVKGAEEFYRTLFGMDVSFRESETPDGWATLPAGADWQKAEAAGLEPGLSLLQREAVALALESHPGAAAAALSHIGLEVTPQELKEVRERAAVLHCRIIGEREDLLVLLDPFGVQWELTTSSRLVSSGERYGRWIAIKRQGT